MHNGLSYRFIFDGVRRTICEGNKNKQKTVISEGNCLAGWLACCGWTLGILFYIEDGWSCLMESGYGNSFSSPLVFVLRGFLLLSRPPFCFLSIV